MMNKVFEVIEAQRIFNIDINKFEILVHPKSYLHAIVKFNNGLIKMLFHDTDMKIPIFNSLYSDQPKKINTNKINFANLNNLNLSYPDTNKFKEHTGWTPEIPYDKTMRDLLDYWRQRIKNNNDIINRT